MGYVAYVSLALALSAQGGAAIWWAGIINTRVAMSNGSSTIWR